jgi:uncharacterized protein (TIGR03067 family)
MGTASDLAYHFGGSDTMRLHAMMAVAAGLLIAADAPKDQSAESDRDRLQGTWTLISAVRDGKPLAEDEAKRTTIVFAGDRFRFPREAADATSQRGTLKIDPTKRPKQMDATSPTGEVSPGIYEVEGDDYRVCFAPPGQERPTAFGSEPGSGTIYQVWKRAKP